MPELSNLIAFLFATMVLLIIPGPAVMFVVGKSIDQGRLAGIVSVLGIAVGTIFHVIAAAFGVSVLLTTSELAFNLLKFAGAAYLIYLGLVNIFSKSKPIQIEHQNKAQSLMKVFFQGVLVNTLNPKTALFIFSFIPQFVSIGTYAVEIQILSMGICFIIMGVVFDSTYVMIADAIKKLLIGHTQIGHIQKRVSGTIYLLLGFFTLTLSPSKIK